jgi:CBS domain containing-hemolysin-like protein
MTTLLVIIWIILLIGLVIVVAVRPSRSLHSWFELQRQNNEPQIRRERLLGDIFALRRFVAIVLIIGLSSLGVVIWYSWGVLATIVGVLVALQLGYVPVVRKRANQLYKTREPKLLDIVEKLPIIGRILGADRHVPHDQHIESTQQLLHLVESAGHVLTTAQQDIIRRGMDWHTVQVSEVMTPRDAIVSVRHSELLGPLVLHDLHESHHTVFPVIKKDLDHVVGIVDIAEFLQVDKTRSSHTAEKVMIPVVRTIEKNDFLPDALELLVTSRQPFLIVTSDGATVGLVTLSDVLGALLGKNRGEVVE